MSFLEKLADAKLLLNPKILVPLATASGLLTLLPAATIEKLGLQAVSEKLAPWPGLVFILSVTGLVTHLAFWAVPAVYNKRRRSKRAEELRAHRIKRIQDLTPAEQSVLVGYYTDRSREQKLPFDEGVVADLTSAGIIRPAPIPGTTTIPIMAGTQSFLMQDWAWEHMVEHPEILGDARPLSRDRWTDGLRRG